MSAVHRPPPTPNHPTRIRQSEPVDLHQSSDALAYAPPYRALHCELSKGNPGTSQSGLQHHSTAIWWADPGLTLLAPAPGLPHEQCGTPPHFSTLSRALFACFWLLTVMGPSFALYGGGRAKPGFCGVTPQSDCCCIAARTHGRECTRRNSCNCMHTYFFTSWISAKTHVWGGVRFESGSGLLACRRRGL
ncbi:unnamed protein product [Periconia digitata]|uniref:Uncharacterized protein n=1 Tax=Periconia digitata TaxID=1303443 RepID=A0A9W4U603_9PLEO|nr:unnamed protein product [Periconia digitata]